MLLADTGRDLDIWIDAATNYARAGLTLLWFVPEDYSLPCLYRFCFSPGFRDDIAARIDARVTTLKAQAQTETDAANLEAVKTDLRTIDWAVQQMQNHWVLEDRVKQSIEFLLRSALSNTITPELVEALK